MERPLEGYTASGHGKTMTDIELQEILADCLPQEMRQENGQILYSGIDTLRSGEFYFFGFNPAADGTNPPLSNPELHPKEWSAYACQCWMDKGKCNAKECSKTGEAKHQKNVKQIMSELGLDPKTTFATNFIFVESKDVNALKKRAKFATYVENCWRVHKKMLAVVRPKYIVCLDH